MLYLGRPTIDRVGGSAAIAARISGEALLETVLVERVAIVLFRGSLSVKRVVGSSHRSPTGNGLM